MLGVWSLCEVRGGMRVCWVCGHCVKLGVS